MELCRKITSLFSVVYVTVPSMDVGRKIAKEIVEGKLAACVNIVPQVVSIYSWKGKIEEDIELLLIIKTRTSLVDELKKSVMKNHPYDVPEFISLAVEQGSEPYLKWIEEQTSAPGIDQNKYDETTTQHSSP